MPETITIDLATLLVFTMPGFFFLKALGLKNKSDLEYFMYSLFLGILLLFFVYEKIFSQENFGSLVGNPFAGAIIFSLSGLLLGWAIRFVKETVRLPFEF